MKKICIPFAIVTILFNSYSFAQSKTTKPKAYLGFGLGLDYGGIGLKAQYQPIPYLGILAGVGFNLYEPGYNLGIEILPLPNKKLQPVLFAMYGYNALVLVKNWSEVSKTYYGASVGAGLFLHTGKKGNNFGLSLIVPFRDPAYAENVRKIEQTGLSINNKPGDVLISFGFNIRLYNKPQK